MRLVRLGVSAGRVHVLGDPRYDNAAARVAAVSPDEPLLLHLDGELREPGVRECTVTVEPRCLNVLVAR